MTATTPALLKEGQEASAALGLLDIIVLAGGLGPEREVSLQSGQAVADALTRLGHEVELCDITPGDLTAIDRRADFVFIALHGKFGEDGQIQSLLEERNLPYAGSRVDASRLAFDKAETKRVLRRAGIPTPDWAMVDATVDTGAVSESLARIPVPAVIKPVASGSSVDTSIVRTEEQKAAELRRLVDQDGSALLEAYIEGIELTVGILGERALPICEIRTKREFYDYQAKYIDDDTQYLFDIDLPRTLLDKVSEMSLSAHQALGCAACSRVDWMVDRKTITPYVLEINTIPGFTSHSLLPKAAARIGVGFDELCQTIVELSLRTSGAGASGAGTLDGGR